MPDLDLKGLEGRGDLRWYVVQARYPLFKQVKVSPNTFYLCRELIKGGDIVTTPWGMLSKYYLTAPEIPVSFPPTEHEMPLANMLGYKFNWVWFTGDGSHD